MISLEVKFLKKYEKLLKNKNRYSIVYGGRASGKTYQISLFILLESLKETQRIVVVRKVKDKVDDSLYYEIISHIKRLKIEHLYKITRSPFKIKCLQTGSEIVFIGVMFSQRFKGFSDAKVVWVDEADELTREDWDFMDLTIRAKDSKILLSFNPPRSDGTEHWIYKEFFSKKRDDTIILHTTYKDNSYLGDAFISVLEHRMKTDETAFRRDVLGEWVVEKEARIYQNYEVKEVLEISSRPLYGLDFGFEDLTAFLEVFVLSSSEIYISKEVVSSHVEPSDLGIFLNRLDFSKRSAKIYADSARPELISMLRKEGYSVFSCTKKTNSIISGIDYLRSRKIYVNPRCKETIKELGLYSWELNKKSGLYDTTTPIDKHNHCMDALRYALDDEIFNQKAVYYEHRRHF